MTDETPTEAIEEKPARVFRKKKPSVTELMKRHNITWRTHEGRRVLNIPTTVDDSVKAELYAALKATR